MSETKREHNNISYIFFGPNAIGKGQEDQRDQIRYDDQRKKSGREDNDEDYIDYEEVD